MCEFFGTTDDERYDRSGGIIKPPVRRETIDLVNGSLTKPLRIREDGIRLGCTFVSKAAVEFIIQQWNDR